MIMNYKKTLEGVQGTHRDGTSLPTDVTNWLFVLRFLQILLFLNLIVLITPTEFFFHLTYPLDFPRGACRHLLL